MARSTGPWSGIAAGIRLVDHHCHGVVRDDITDDEFRALAIESDWLAPAGLETLDTPFGLAVRSVCAELLDLPRHSSVPDYLARRTSLGQREVNRRLMGLAGLRAVLIDTGFEAAEVATPAQMALDFGVAAHTVLRLENVAERLAGSTSAGSFGSDLVAALAETVTRPHGGVVGFKSVAAYRSGLEPPDTPPSAAEVRRAAGRWLNRVERTGMTRIDDPVLLAHLVWAAVPHQLPIQFHVGFGDSDVLISRSDPSLLTPFLRATRTSGTSVMLLHTYPYTRTAGCLAHVFPHVYLDVGEVSHYTGPSAIASIRQSVELAPFHKILFSSDAYGLAEHYAVSAALWRRGISKVVDEWIRDDFVSVADAESIVHRIAAENAARVYRLPAEPLGNGAGTTALNRSPAGT